MTVLSIATLFDGNHNHDRLSAFIEGFAEALHAGGGRKPQFLDAIGIDVAFPVRLLVGVPTKALSREQRLVAETYCSMFSGRNFGDCAKLWATGKGWQPKNPGRVPGSIQDSRLDVDWMLSLGIGRATWERSILISDGAMMRSAKGMVAGSTTLRHLLALAAFGFRDPYQFFTTSP